MKPQRAAWVLAEPWGRERTTLVLLLLIAVGAAALSVGGGLSLNELNVGGTLFIYIALAQADRKSVV